MSNTRESIIENAMKLFRENGYENTSVMDICNAANITKGTFYYHFPNKYELCYQFYEVMFQGFSSIMPELIMIENAKDQLWKVYEFSVDRTVKLGPVLLKSLYMADIQKGFQVFTPYARWDLDTETSKYLKLQIDLVRKGQKSGEIKKGDAESMVRTFAAAIAGIAIAWGCSNGAFDEKKEIKKAFDTVFTL